MKKVIRLTESDLVRLVKRVINEQSGKWSFIKGETVKIPIKKPQMSFIVVKIIELESNEPGNLTQTFTVIESTYDKMKKGYKGNFETYDNYTYTLFSNDGRELQSGPIKEIKEIKKL